MKDFELDEGVAVGFKKELGAEGHICEVSFTTSAAAIRAIAIIIQKVAAVLGVTAQHVLCVLATVLIRPDEEESQTVGERGSAAGGGRSDRSEVQRSIKARESVSPKILSGTAKGKDDPSTPVDFRHDNGRGGAPDGAEECDTN